MKVSLFSQSLFALSLTDAIEATAELGFPAIELACTEPHFDIDTARGDPRRAAAQIRENGLSVSALSLFNNLTDPIELDAELDRAGTFIRLAPLFRTDLLKLTPGPPGLGEATCEHWDCVADAIDRLVPLAEEVGVRLAFETHMRQLTGTLAGARRLLAVTTSNTVGLTVDFSNLSFAGESMPEVISSLRGRIYNTHVKNGTIGADGSWHFHALDTGLTDYAEVFSLLRETDYSGYLTLECLGTAARERPLETVARDLAFLRSYCDP